MTRFAPRGQLRIGFHPVTLHVIDLKKSFYRAVKKAWNSTHPVVHYVGLLSVLFSQASHNVFNRDRFREKG
jgi:hypothetical protein